MGGGLTHRHDHLRGHDDIGLDASDPIALDGAFDCLLLEGLIVWADKGPHRGGIAEHRRAFIFNSLQTRVLVSDRALQSVSGRSNVADDLVKPASDRGSLSIIWKFSSAVWSIHKPRSGPPYR
jgi:hypothetical protein